MTKIQNVVKKLVEVALLEKRKNELEFDALTRFEDFATLNSIVITNLGFDNIEKNMYQVHKDFYDYKMKNFYHQVKYKGC